MLSLDKSESIDNESDKFGSESGSSGTYYFCDFSLRAEEYVDIFLRLNFSHQPESNTNVVESIQYFALALKFRFFVRNLKISFIIFPSIVSQYCSNRCYLTYNMIRRSPRGIVWRPSDGTGSGAPYSRIFIQCVNDRYPMSNQLWSHGLDGLCRYVRPTALVEIPPRTYR